MSSTRELVDDLLEKLEEFKQESLVKLHEIDRLLFFVDGDLHKSATAYWIPHITIALTDDHQWIAGSMCNLEDTVKGLEGIRDDLAQDDQESE